ncbi:hypothetical protein O9Z70_13480 [Devosia sp. YIM 151766]|uniref:hypothetical protein n=1 Tax=Devosia sp. YIM 151766 TaxID=3017325 RepID=UPI00255C5D41|nr:hypothetical protein [Devosia sp. YIM 151766]WIY52460.1 hypothetical protein O9Z70_13480 [Devosia sp. YIM 151766]
MLRLDLKRQAIWVDLGHGVRLECDPLTTAVMAAARKDPSVRELPEDTSQDDMAIVMAKAVARRVVRAWSGVGDVDGVALKVSPEGINALLDIWVLFDAFQTKYLASGFLLDQEKNGSAPSPIGISAGAIATARPAKGSAKSARPKSTRRKP